MVNIEAIIAFYSVYLKLKVVQQIENISRQVVATGPTPDCVLCVDQANQAKSVRQITEYLLHTNWRFGKIEFSRSKYVRK